MDVIKGNAKCCTPEISCASETLSMSKHNARMLLLQLGVKQV